MLVVPWQALRFLVPAEEDRQLKRRPVLDGVSGGGAVALAVEGRDSACGVYVGGCWRHRHSFESGPFAVCFTLFFIGGSRRRPRSFESGPRTVDCSSFSPCSAGDFGCAKFLSIGQVRFELDVGPLDVWPGGQAEERFNAAAS